MGRDERRAVPALIERLKAEPHGFDFHQAVRLLDILRERGDVRDRPTRFRGVIDFAFPSSDLSACELEGKDHTPSLTVAFLTLAGGHGPLPAPLAQLVQERVRSGDTATRDFLDIFNHRLISLLAEGKRAVTPVLQLKRPEDGPFADYLWALVGLLTPGLRRTKTAPERRRLLGHERALLAHAGIMSMRPVSMHALERLFSGHFGLNITGRSFVGRWLDIEPDDQTVLGPLGRNTELGRNAVLGTQSWDQGAAIRLTIGPMAPRRFVEFLPGGRAWRTVYVLLGALLDSTVEVELELLLDPARPIRSVLTSRRNSAAPRLGWTAWLTTGRGKAPMAVTLPMGAPGAPPEAWTVEPKRSATA